MAWIVRPDFFKTIVNFFSCLTLRASLGQLRTRYIKHAMVSCHAHTNTEKQQNSNKCSHGISPLSGPSYGVGTTGSALGERWPSRLVATAGRKRLDIAAIFLRFAVWLAAYVIVGLLM